jgi:hypothetical protein
VSETYESLMESMRQLGFDRAVDLLSVGKFDELLDIDTKELSYIGKAIECLTNGLSAIDDVRTRQQIIDIRDQLIAQQTSELIAAVDTVDQGRTRLIGRLKSRITSIQKNAKTVESIVEQLQTLGAEVGANMTAAVSSATAFAANLDHLAVNAGGRLAQSLEDYAEHPNTGIPGCNGS